MLFDQCVDVIGNSYKNDRCLYCVVRNALNGFCEKQSCSWVSNRIKFIKNKDNTRFSCDPLQLRMNQIWGDILTYDIARQGPLLFSLTSPNFREHFFPNGLSAIPRCASNP